MVYFLCSLLIASVSLAPSNLVLACECLGWNWQNSVKTFNVKLTQKAITKYPYRFSNHLFDLYISFPIFHHDSQYPVLLLSLSIVIALSCPSKFRLLLFSFRKMWGYPTSPISWYINFKTENCLGVCLIQRSYYLLFLSNNRSSHQRLSL